ncbi:hypothetical protein B7R54_04365 [Subtercola boreus]|uniref:SnoaL-like domain-containing protein n=1 Tax=Subtercola boreus TaxID=120213 RepID=A0A3E0VF33_9MICO|nr:limonene-1,2-epoxide hydrolase family protein [Subtercola boreus]RFA08544.1 hypothetical protein B7R54_04365 [Subtercola boreus]TQL54527.1 limonene-1,2-epoxide hydrolase [Subtercola boreus]
MSAADEASVLDFFSCWETNEVDRMMTFFTPDAEYIDVPLPHREPGTEAIRAHIAGTLDGLTLKIETLHIGSTADGVILTERIDYIGVKGSDAPDVALPVMGVMEMQGGRIAVWRDYFDVGFLEAGLGISLR